MLEPPGMGVFMILPGRFLAPPSEIPLKNSELTLSKCTPELVQVPVHNLQATKSWRSHLARRAALFQCPKGMESQTLQ